MPRYAYVIDLNRCMGCNACVEACKIENNTGEGMLWMYVFRLEKGKYPDVNWQFMPRPCMHCDNPPCVKVCPVGARFKREDGFTLTDFDRCIGCRFCEVSCPYGVNYFNWKKPKDNQYFAWHEEEGAGVYGSGSAGQIIGNAVVPYENPDHKKLYGERLVSGGAHYLGVVGKCTWCVHRVEKGLPPACVANCPVHALHFGDLDDPGSEVSNLLKRGNVWRLLEELGTEPRVYYLGGQQPGHDLRLWYTRRQEVKA
ncbi:MAG: hypothetical protein A2W25_01880 [candidate division Zixibacteria bacterium RBG_16_53_22]|nr:MAG: hypothetical protein A2W25_01880 [candidate division Zixibacteria bacterium RBG_16_53_22]